MTEQEQVTEKETSTDNVAFAEHKQPADGHAAATGATDPKDEKDPGKKFYFNSEFKFRGETIKAFETVVFAKDMDHAMEEQKLAWMGGLICRMQSVRVEDKFFDTTSEEGQKALHEYGKAEREPQRKQQADKLREFANEIEAGRAEMSSANSFIDLLRY